MACSYEQFVSLIEFYFVLFIYFFEYKIVLNFFCRNNCQLYRWKVRQNSWMLFRRFFSSFLFLIFFRITQTWVYLSIFCCCFEIQLNPFITNRSAPPKPFVITGIRYKCSHGLYFKNLSFWWKYKIYKVFTLKFELIN
jgi:hypothetical protein